MRHYFPRQTVEWKLEEPRAFRRFSLSLVEMAVTTGVVLRVYRAIVLSHDQVSWLYTGGTYLFGLLLLLAMLTLHLGNFPLQKWAWRAPAFALVEWAAEMATSALLLLVHREPYGSGRAEWSNWSSLATDALVTRALAILLFTLLLAAVVQVVRRVMAGQVLEEREAS